MKRRLTFFCFFSLVYFSFRKEELVENVLYLDLIWIYEKICIDLCMWQRLPMSLIFGPDIISFLFMQGK